MKYLLHGWWAILCAVFCNTMLQYPWYPHRKDGKFIVWKCSCCGRTWNRTVTTSRSR